MNKKLMQGTFWLTFANLLCKVLGVVYLIPWLSMMGNNQDGMLATTLYNVGYLPYGLFLMLGTVGFPNAIAKKVAVATKEGDNAACRLIFRSTINIMFVIGIASAALMYLFAPLLAGISPIANVNNGILAIKSLCPSLIAIPILSAMRGYFQGKNDLRPYGTSLIIEQAVRVIVILAGTYYLRVLTDGTILEAVLISTVASFFGGLAAIIHMYIVGRRKDFFELKDFLISSRYFERENRSASVSIIRETLPFIFVGSVITIVQMIDQVTMKPLLHFFRPEIADQQLEFLFSRASVNPNKLTLILISMVGTVAISSLPILSTMKKKDRIQIEKTVGDSFSIALLILLPSLTGMSLLAGPLYTLFFGYDPESVGYFQMALLASLFFSLFTIQSTMLQSLNHHRFAIRLTVEAIILKVIFEVIGLGLVGGYGMSLSNGLAFGIVFVRGYHFMCKEYRIAPLAKISNFFLKTFRSTLIMLAVCFAVFFLLNQRLSMESKSYAMIYCVAVGSIGGLVFLFSQFGKNGFRMLKNVKHHSRSKE
ncbi:polysaccharide biosynthesis protein [Enterococcus faecium]|uniref:polysaccharide biosynthesis protein n=1 Tax=Enterococcus faecium TaxID=1352 RepID=UPI000CF2EAC2|nr:polysaccharide biosynthesis protein [Enterococcus faecium]EME3492260.1 polysaccharide biosynthesis protein [Enterococcus faecium]EME7173280.1 polysaccharide biosynthesis protein [Enterococcus faecium]PQE76716.1 polysaccharide biosynthesis protein [Enterococcus faecium]PQG93374.1 polysaccharide biosynthesis protein [Enterococcus faecium]RBS32901.1 polysaccharide biosynthesis protein [Enterococcus faecium]